MYIGNRIKLSFIDSLQFIGKKNLNTKPLMEKVSNIRGKYIGIWIWMPTSFDPDQGRSNCSQFYNSVRVG